MTEESRRFIGDLVWNDRNFMEAFTAKYSFINSDLAAVYKTSPPARDYQRVEFPLEAERAGLLGQALFLTLSSKPDETAPTGRGLFIREQFLCQQVPPPPPGVDTNLPPVEESKPVTNRERLAMHAGNKMCAGCHNLIDPIGFGFEKFDAIGMRREKHKLLFYPNLDGRGGAAGKTERDRVGTGHEGVGRRNSSSLNFPAPENSANSSPRRRSVRNASSNRCSGTCPDGRILPPTGPC